MPRKLTAATGRSIYGNLSAPTTARAKASNLSAETVEDSTSEDEPAISSKQSARQSSASDESEESEDSDGDDEEDEQESDSSQDEAVGSQQVTESQKVGILKPMQSTVTNGTLSKRKSSDISGDEEDSSSSEPEMNAPSKRQRLDNSSVVLPQSSAPTESETATAQASTITAQQFLPPEDFAPIAGSATTTISPSQVGRVVLWQVAVPKGVSKESLSRLDLRDGQLGKAVITHNGRQYTFRDGSNYWSNPSLRLQRDHRYSVEAQVEKAYVLAPKLDLPSIPDIAASRSVDSQAAADIATAAVTTIRPQPKGLRMRYKPPGSDSRGLDVIGSSSDEEQERAPQPSFQFPRAVGGHTSLVNGETSSVSQKLLKKKEARSKNHEAKLANGAGKTAKATPKLSQMSQESIASTQQTEESSQDPENLERAKRKAERKRKKLLKQQAKDLAAQS